MSVSQNLIHIQNQIDRAALAASALPEAVTLVAVSKKQPDSRIEEALAAGQHVFGENRVQEAQKRWTARRPLYPDLKLHLIGPLQTNKAKDAVALFDVIETLDREKLARVLASEMRKQERSLPCFIQVNTGNEPQKSGILPEALAEFYEFCVGKCDLNISGLMCIPPMNEPSEPHFELLARLGRKHGLSSLSMGMSGDFEQAIAQGANYVRVGTGVFGPRPVSA